MSYKIALAGNPNSGKTTLFNELTGARGNVGNWPGVTVEKKEGKIRNIKDDLSLVDLPGIYSLSPYSAEEVIARDYIVKDRPDLIINIVDATNIERNLYLTLQLLETGVPVIIALNMMDAVTIKGDTINTDVISKALKVPIIEISASKAEGIDKLLDKILAVKAESRKNEEENRLNIYDRDVQVAISDVSNLMDDKVNQLQKAWYAVKLLEEDPLIRKELALTNEKQNMVFSIIKRLNSKYGMDVEVAIADMRYKFIEKIIRKAVIKAVSGDSETITDKIDRVLTNKFLAIPIFLLTMLLVFQITFSWVGSAITEILDGFISQAIESSGTFLANAGASEWAVSLVSDGIFSGLGAVITFLPQIMLMYFFLGLLEDSGYMARAAFIMDRLLRKIGLSGRSFVPMLMGFGCSVPAIMAARTLENERDRKITIILTPFMSCGAKMPVYAVFIGAFFLRNKGLVIFSIYMLGILMAILSGFLLKRVLFKGKISSFVMELPPYRIPTLKALSRRIWQQVKHFIARAGSILLGATIVVWFLQSFDFSLNMVENSSESILSVVGRALAPVFAPLGFGNWKASVALLTGLIAKESVVSTLGVLYKADGVQLVASIQNIFTPLTAYAYMAFVLLYIPCISAFSTAKKELNSWKWAIGAGLYQTGVAWLVAFIIYQGGRLFGL